MLANAKPRIEANGLFQGYVGMAMDLTELALHELGVNAVKYGALTVAEGRVVIGWRIDEADRAIVTWKERPSKRPATRGLDRVSSTMV